MNGYDIYSRSAVRIGISGTADEIVSDSRLLARALELINQISADLKLEEISNLSDEISCSETEVEALCCGVVMLLSLSDGDTAKNQLYTGIYNAKRATVLGGISHVEDNLPVAESGDA